MKKETYRDDFEHRGNFRGNRRSGGQSQSGRGGYGRDEYGRHEGQDYDTPQAGGGLGRHQWAQTHNAWTARDERYGQDEIGGNQWSPESGQSQQWGQSRGQSGQYPHRTQYSDHAYGEAEGQHKGRGPKGYSRSDDRIREDICEALTVHPHVDASDIEVEVSQGEVTLRGTVVDRRAKRIAEDAIEHTSGVQEVHNQLRVKRAERETEKYANVRSGEPADEQQLEPEKRSGRS